jgi:acyl-ACP thioesterase
MSKASRSNQMDHRQQSKMNQIPIGIHSGFAKRKIQIRKNGTKIRALQKTWISLTSPAREIQIIKNGTKIRAQQKNLNITDFFGS